MPPQRRARGDMPPPLAGAIRVRRDRDHADRRDGMNGIAVHMPTARSDCAGQPLDDLRQEETEAVAARDDQEQHEREPPHRRIQQPGAHRGRDVVRCSHVRARSASTSHCFSSSRQPPRRGRGLVRYDERDDAERRPPAIPSTRNSHCQPSRPAAAVAATAARPRAVRRRCPPPCWRSRTGPRRGRVRARETSR